MKYLIKREDFLRSTKVNETNSDFLRNGRLTGLQAINEVGGPLSNDLGWGDSLLGRLINSSIRKGKISYNTTKVQPLLDALRMQLDVIIANSLSKDTKEEFNKLRIRSYLSELRNICTDDITDEEKLDELIGGHEDLWDATRQDGGLWSNVLTGGVLVDTHDFIENEMDKGDLEKAGIPRDGLLDEMSIFIDNLRRLTPSNRSAVVTTAAHQKISFAANFKNVVNALSTIKEGYSSQYENIITDFNQFIAEEIDVTAETIRKKIESGEKQLKDKSITPEERAELEKAIAHDRETVKGLVGGDTSPAIRTGVGPSTGAAKNLLGTGAESKSVPAKKSAQTSTEVAKIDAKKPDAAKTAAGATKPAPNELGPDSKSRWIKIKQLAAKCVDKEFENTEDVLNNTDCISLIKALAALTSSDLEYIMTKNIGAKIKIDDNEIPMDNAIETIVQKKDIEKVVNQIKVSGVRIKDSSKQIAMNPKYSKEQKREILSKRLNRYKSKIAKKPNDDFSKTKTKELEVYIKQIGEGFSYSARYDGIYEAAAATASSVLDCWENFVSGAGIKDEFLEISQREHDRLNGLLNGIDSEKTILKFNLSENPDPIVAITRIFKRAHDLYYTDVIPSGRSSGAVSNKTFREYERLGGGASSQTSQDNPGVGPWAVKSIRNKWVDGVMEILEDQKYRKILANIRFVVPGSEDTFNDANIRTTEQLLMKWDNFIKIIEEAEVEDKDKKSHGQILFDFINDMLSDEAAASFDKQRRILMKKYFGFKDEAIAKVEEKDKNIPPVDKTPKPDDTVKKSMFWKSIKEFKGVSDSGYKGQFYAIPIQKTGNGHRMLFLHLLRKVDLDGKSGYLIKFTFDQPAIAEKFIEEKHPGYKIETDWKTGDAKFVYYGIINGFPSGKFKISMLNTSSNKITSDTYNLEAGYDMDINGRKVAVFTANLWMTDENNKTTLIDTDFAKKVLAESDDHKTLDLSKLTEEAKNNLFKK